MKQILPWNVTGIPPEARKVARAAAARDGLSVGDWLTRRIYIESQQEMQEPRAEPRSMNRSEGDNAAHRDRDEIMRQLARMEAETESAFRRIGESLQTLGRRLKTPESLQNEAKIPAHRAASEIREAEHEHAQKIIQLARRVENIERTTDSAPLRNAVRGLHHSVSRLAEQVAKSENDSVSRIAALTQNVEGASKVAQATRVEYDQLAKNFGERLSALTEKIAHSEDRLGGMEEQFHEAWDRRTSSLERNFEAIADRLNEAERNQSEQKSSVEEAFKDLKGQLSATETRHHDAYSEFRLSLEEMKRRLDSADLKPEWESKYGPSAADGESHSPLRGTRDAFVPLEENPHTTSVAQEFLSTARRSANSATEAYPLTGRPGLADARINRDRDSREDESGDLRRALPAISIALLLVTGVMYFILNSGSSPFSDSIGSVQRSLTPASANAAEPNAVLALPLALGPYSTPDGGTGRDQGRVTSDRPATSSNTLLNMGAEAPAHFSNPGQYVSLDLPKPSGSAATMNLPSLSETQAAKASSLPSARPAALDGQVARGQTAGGQALEGRASRTSQTAGPMSSTLFESLLLKARDGSSEAALLVGLQYLEEDGGVSASEGVRWLRAAAERGQPVAQYRLGSIYEHGRRVPADPDQAAFWYEQAARSGNRKAMHNFAVAYVYGIGIEENLAKASHWFKSAAELGLTDSQFNLAVLYERGIGARPSLNEAYKWYVIAASQGDTEARARAGVLGAQLAEDQRLVAERSAMTYAPRPLDQAANELPTHAQIQ